MTINVNPLSYNSIQEAIRQITEYQNSLEYKCKVFLNRLADIGVNVIGSTYMGEGDSGPKPDTSREWGSGKTAELVLNVSGENLIFIEFGAGITFNGPVGSAAYPRAEELGFTIGSYSDSVGNGYSQGQFEYWYYQGADGARHRSYGTEAKHPVYNAAQAMRDAIVQTAIEVFKEGGGK